MNQFAHPSRRQFLKLSAGVFAASNITSSAQIFSAEKNGMVHLAAVGVGGMGRGQTNGLLSHPNTRLVAICDADRSAMETTLKQKSIQSRPEAKDIKLFQDYREMLDQLGDKIDAVGVATPDHMHAPIGLSAIDAGKHVYLQKPLAQDIKECRLLAEAAGKQGVVSQMGIQVHAHLAYRLAPRIIQAGLIGKVHEVHSWSGKGWGGEIASKPGETPPNNLDWNLYCGVSEQVPYVGGRYYHPGNWRKFLNFGTGTQGDMMCHIVDPVYSALQLTAPTTVVSRGPKPHERTFAYDSHVTYTFPQTAQTTETLTLHWYNGRLHPPQTISLDKKLPSQGSIFIGEQGRLLLPHVGMPQVFGKKLSPTEEQKIKTITQELNATNYNHYQEFIDVIVGKKKKTGAHFDYAGPLTEVVLMGTVINRWPDKTFDWDAANCQFKNADEANALLLPAYRKGWNVPYANAKG